VALERHRVKLGIDARRLESHLQARPYDLFANVADLNATMADAITSASLSTQPTAVRPRFTNLSLFAQDTWFASPRFTLDLGVRWELNPPPTEASHQLPYTTLDSESSRVTIAPAGTPLWRTRGRNVAPRLGVAWLLRTTPGLETMLRTGGGLFYDLGNTQATRGYEGYGYRYSRDLVLRFPLDVANIVASATPYWFEGSLYTFDPNLQLPYTGQWNLSIEQALGAGRSLTVSYVGAAGRRQLAQLHRLFTVLSPQNTPFPSLYETTNDGRSDYHALQWQFQQRLSSRLQVSVAHTWSHAIDVISAESRMEAASTMSRADADFDVRHVVSATAGYDLPWHVSVDGRVSMQSGRPFNVIATSSYDEQGLETTLWAAHLDGTPLTIASADSPGGWRLNPQAFGGAVSLMPNRNLVRAPGVWQLDLAARRAFPLIGSSRLTLQVNAFNALNHPNFGGIDSRVASPTFGEARAMFGRTVGGLNPSYQIGGPRTLELVLRVAF
jgi:hypothetical protein